MKPEQGLCEPREAAEMADEPENGDSDSSGAGSVKPENPDDPDHSGDDYGDAPDADEVETEADSPPPTSNNKSGRKRGLSQLVWKVQVNLFVCCVSCPLCFLSAVFFVCCVCFFLLCFCFKLSELTIIITMLNCQAPRTFEHEYFQGSLLVKLLNINNYERKK